jgi:site-specific recombinase XerD
LKLIHTGFSDWLQSTAFETPYSPHTIRLYSKVCADFDAFCQDEHINLCDEFGSPHVRKFTGASVTGKPYAKSTINSRLVALELIFTYLQEIDECNENPVIYYRDTKIKKRGGIGGRAAIRLPECLSWDEQERLLHASMSDDTFTGYRNSALVAMILDTGLRTQEAIDLPLSAGDDYLAGRLRVVGKGNKERLVRFTPMHSDFISAWLKKRRHQSLKKQFVNRLFVSERGGNMQQQTVYYAINKLLEQANITGKQQNGGHLLRHTAASVMLASGLPLKQVQENLGHSSLMTTEKYLHLLDQKT